MRVRIKICGITREEDACAAAHAGADAIGFVFDRQSPRFIEPRDAARIAECVAPFVSTVGLFVDPEPGWLRAVLDHVRIDLLQFHGDESEKTCESFAETFARPYIKAVRVLGPASVAALDRGHPCARALLLDSARGGSGMRFDWALWPREAKRPLILAGGLDASNVGEAICALRPFAVDVSSGVETGVKGVKDPGKIRSFVDEVQRAVHALQSDHRP